MFKSMAARMPDLDDVFSYTTTRKLAIRDRRLGFIALAARLSIFLYVVVYQIVFNQQYMAPTSVIGLSRMSLKRPTAEYRWADGTAPYCTGSVYNVTASPRLANYVVWPGNASYMYVGPGGSGLAVQQAACAYLDARMAIPTPPQGSEIFMPSRITTTTEYAVPSAECAQLAHSYCEWQTNATLTANDFVVDTEMFTLLLDHSFAATSAGIARSSADMTGRLLGPNNELTDPCEAYSVFPAGCPSFINIGDRSKAASDILALRTLLHAGGVETLDQVAGASSSLNTQTKRNAGVVIVINILYTNYYLPGGGIPFGTGHMDENNVQYGYDIQIVPEQEYKAESVYTPDNSFPNSVRQTYNRHGVRIVVVQSGRIGRFSFQDLLINLTVSLGLMSVAILITDFVAFSLCKQRRIFGQYMLRKTVDMSDVLDAHDASILERFKKEDDLVDPMPKIFADIIEARKARDAVKEQRNGIVARKTAVEHQLAKTRKRIGKAEKAAAEGRDLFAAAIAKHARTTAAAAEAAKTAGKPPPPVKPLPAKWLGLPELRAAEADLLQQLVALDAQLAALPVPPTADSVGRGEGAGAAGTGLVAVAKGSAAAAGDSGTPATVASGSQSVDIGASPGHVAVGHATSLDANPRTAVVVVPQQNQPEPGAGDGHAGGRGGVEMTAPRGARPSVVQPMYMPAAQAGGAGAAQGRTQYALLHGTGGGPHLIILSPSTGAPTSGSVPPPPVPPAGDHGRRGASPAPSVASHATGAPRPLPRGSMRPNPAAAPPR